MKSKQNKYLLSVGIGFPWLGVYFHKYYNVKNQCKLNYKKILGFTITWVAYKRA